MKLFSYKELENVPLNTIFKKYAPKGITIIQFRSRIHSSHMSIEKAINTPLVIKDPVTEIERKYIDTLYDSLCKITEPHVSKAHFIVKMSNGFSPKKAIVSRYKKSKDKTKTKKPKEDSMEILLAELKKQEKKEKKEAAKKKPKPLNNKEQKYIINLDIVNNAFLKIKTKHKSKVQKYAKV